MLRLELRGRTNEVIATLEVDDDGTARLDGDFPAELAMVAFGRERITMATDPANWARQLHRSYATPDLHPVITRDD